MTYEKPGDEVRRRLAIKRWTQADLARVMERPPKLVSDVINGKRSIQPDTAIGLSAALGDTPEYWMDLESRYQLSKANADATAVRRRASVFDAAPIKDMERRGWIPANLEVDELENALLEFYGIQVLGDSPEFVVATRRSGEQGDLEPSQLAWCTRARNLAADIPCRPYKPSAISKCVDKLRVLAAFPQEIRKVPATLEEFGIRFVVIEPLPNSRIDGAAFWLADTDPVIALSARFDRIDAFWFTLIHELSHVRHGDAMSIDSELLSDGTGSVHVVNEVEERANLEASSTLIPEEKMKSFIGRTRPFYSKKKINQFANRMKIHPGIIVGQLQYRGEIGYHANREMLVGVRDFITSTALTDGWGHTIGSLTHV